MPKLSNEKDRESARDAGEGGARGNIIKLDEGHNFVILLDEDFEQGFVHWVTVGEKTYRRVCKDGLDKDKKGWNPEGCEVCALASEQYELKKEAKTEGDKALAKEYNDRGNKLRANYAAVFKSVKAKSVLERIKNKKTGKFFKKYMPDFNEIAVGKLQLTYPQLKKVFALIEENEETGEKPYDFLDEGSDLMNRVLDFIKKKEGDKLYAEVKEVLPSKKTIEIEINEEDVPDITDEFDFIDDLDKIVALYKGEIEGIDEDEYEEQEIDKKTSKGKTTTAKNKKKKTDDEIPF